MLSVAKHLLFLIENKQSRSFAAAQDDTAVSLFHQPAKQTLEDAVGGGATLPVTNFVTLVSLPSISPSYQR